MRTVYTVAIAACLALVCAVTRVEAQATAPRSVPHSATVNRPTRAVFGALKGYLTTPGGPCTLQKSDEQAGTLVAHCQAADTATWNRWAYCKVGAMSLLDTLQSNSAVATIKVTRSGRNASFLTISADLSAVYAFSSQTSNVACVSNGVLEDQLLTTAGASPAPQPTAAPLF